MKNVLFLFVAFSFFSCEKTVIIRDVKKDFANNRWGATDIKKFEYNLKEDIDKGDIRLLFSHIYEPQYTIVPVSVTLEDPSGVKEDFFMKIRLKDAKGNDLSECAGDVCDNYTPIKEGVKLSKGTYKVTVENKFTYAYLANVLAVGVSVERDKD